MTKEDYNNKIIEDAVNVLKDDGVIIVPTDTIYGFAIDSRSSVAFDKIYKIKKRNLSKRLPIVVESYNRLMSICEISKDQILKLQSF